MQTNVMASRRQLFSWNRIDPRTRIIGLAFFAMFVVSLSSLTALSLALAFSLCSLPFSSLPLSKTLKRMAGMDGFIIFMLVMLPFTMPGEVWFTLFGFVASWEGLWRAVEIALKANAVVLMLMTLIGSMEPVQLGHALYRLKVPENLVQLLLFTVRYIDVLKDEYQRSRTAMKARGFRPANTRHSYRSFGYLVGMMLVKAMERSERILQAMKCRGFNGRWPHVDQLKFGLVDFSFSLSTVAILISLVLVNNL
jgi:cobalt/nickel transport system permease protein